MSSSSVDIVVLNLRGFPLLRRAVEMIRNFQRVGFLATALVLTAWSQAQTNHAAGTKKRSPKPAASQQDLRSLRELVQVQQKQLETQNQQLQELQGQLKQVLDSVQQADATTQKLQTGADQAQATAAQAQQSAEKAEQAATQAYTASAETKIAASHGEQPT